MKKAHQYIKVDYGTFDIIKECYTSVNAVGGDIPYANTYIKGKKMVRLNNFIMGNPEQQGLVVDHINHDTYDNRVVNLRVCTPEVNARNKSFFSGGELPVAGLSYNHNKEKIRVRIGKNSKSILFDKKEYKQAVIYCYNQKLEKGYLFKESSTTIEKYIEHI